MLVNIKCLHKQHLGRFLLVEDSLVIVDYLSLKTKFSCCSRKIHRPLQPVIHCPQAQPEAFLNVRCRSWVSLLVVLRWGQHCAQIKKALWRSVGFCVRFIIVQQGWTAGLGVQPGRVGLAEKKTAGPHLLGWFMMNSITALENCSDWGQTLLERAQQIMHLQL